MFRRRPAFSVVIATYNRDELIAPTLESVRRQTFTDFETLVVSDGEPSLALREIVSTYDERFRLLVLPQRSRSQAGPNNLGWGAARGKFVAYLGHDDVWRPNHLEQLAAVHDHHQNSHFAVSGCLYLGPTGTEGDFTWVTGIFNDDETDAASVFFFPPSALSHRRHLPRGVRHWPDPAVTRRPVDTEFVLGAVETGCRFSSTREVTVFKFASALRYLSYLYPDDVEQRAMLDLFDDPQGLEDFVSRCVNTAREKGGYMASRHAAPDQFMPGEILRINEAARGIVLPEMRRVTSEVHLEVGDDHRALDWHARETDGSLSWRWSGPNCRPRLLLPFWCDEPVHIRLKVLHFAKEDVDQSLRVVANGVETEFEMLRIDGRIEVAFVATLKKDSPSLLELRMVRSVPASEIDPLTQDGRRLGLCLLGVVLAPASAVLPTDGT